MSSVLWLLPIVPLASSLILILFGPRFPKAATALLGVGSVGTSACLATAIAAAYLASPFAGSAYAERLWTWIDASGLRVEFALYLDGLSLTMTLVVTIVGFLIHLYSAEHMRSTEGYSRFFAYMNLFVAAMLILVLARDMVLLYLGWEGVGLCSFLLIGFHYAEQNSVSASRKAFVVTRVGDVAFALGLLWLYRTLGTLDIPAVNSGVTAAFRQGSREATLIALLLLGGAVGKSAQLPLQTWLPDAMAGPTPTSALIHAATMVTAGVYLLARLDAVFAMAPAVMTVVAIVGTLTMLISAVSAAVQSDIKRVLAYSTMSQIGLMFVALGVGAWTVAIFHLVTHACFKALLFLSAGIVIDAVHHEHDIFKMGGLWRALPLALFGFVVGGAALAGLPLISAGYYSKERIVFAALAAPGGNVWLWGAAVVGACLTAVYVTRLVYLVFWGPIRTSPSIRIGPAVRLPVYVLGALSVVTGFLQVPEWLARLTPSQAANLQGAPVAMSHAGMSEEVSGLWASLAFAVGVGLALFVLVKRREQLESLVRHGLGQRLHAVLKAGWAFDWLYERLVVRPFFAISRAAGRDDPDRIFEGTSQLLLLTSRELGRTETGKLRWYAAVIAAGTALLLAIVVWAP